MVFISSEESAAALMLLYRMIQGCNCIALEALVMEEGLVVPSDQNSI
jgi:hypothetical protein